MPTTPATIADGTVFADGTLLTAVESVDLPDVEQLTETLSHLGQAGEVEVPSAHVSLGTATINFGSYTEDIRLFTPQQAVQLEVRFSINDVTNDGVQEFPRTVSMRVLRQTMSNDTLERQRDEGPELEVAVHYLEDQINGELVTEIDPVNRTFVWEGEDLLAGRKTNLGL